MAGQEETLNISGSVTALPVGVLENDRGFGSLLVLVHFLLQDN